MRSTILNQCYLMLKEGVVQVNIKATCKTDISQRPFDRICHPQHCPSFKGLWILLCEIDMNNLQAKMLLALMRKKNSNAINRKSYGSSGTTNLIFIIFDSDARMREKGMLSIITVLIRTQFTHKT